MPQVVNPTFQDDSVLTQVRTSLHKNAKNPGKRAKKSTKGGQGLDVLYRIPIVNLFWIFVDDGHDPPEWSQYTGLLNVLAITVALVLALVCTFYSALDYDEMARAQLRFSWGLQDENGNNRPLIYSNPLCLIGQGVTLDDSVVDNRAEFCVNQFGGAWQVPSASETDVYKQSYPWCDYPCFSDRPIDDSGDLVSGNYSFWWAWQATGRPDRTELLTDSDLTYLLYPVELFSRDCIIACAVLSLSLLLSVIILATGNPNVFTREQDAGGFSFQYRTLMKSYFYWVKWGLAMVIITAIVGVILFFQIIKSMVYIKFTDQEVASTGEYATWLSSGGSSTYGFTHTAIFWCCYIWVALGAFILGLGYRAMFSFPEHAFTNLSNIGDYGARKLRLRAAQMMVSFLVRECGLPKCSNNQQFGPRTSVFWCFYPGEWREKAVREDKGIYQNAAAGVKSSEAEVCADALIDSGVYEASTIMKLVAYNPSALLAVPGMTPAAVMYIIEGVQMLYKKRHFSDLSELSSGELSADDASRKIRECVREYQAFQN